MSIGTKLNQIYGDLSANVTKIYDRQPLHLAFDLAYHSVLAFQFGTKFLHKGWVECLIIGDTRCGKTTIADALRKHYRLGDLASGETASYAGLVGGLDKVNGQWEVRWGRIPLNHRRLLVIDEVSGLDHEEIAKMSQIRSEGKVIMTKIKTRETHGKVRLIWMSNPREAKTIEDYAYGPQLVQSIIGKGEDVARFDFAIIVEKGEVDGKLIDSHLLQETDHTEHIFNSDLCHALVLWAWSRKPNQVKLSKETVRACTDMSQKMQKKYSEACQLVTQTEQAFKLAKLATSLACRLFSTLDGESVIVQPAHVEYIYDYLNTIYDSPHFQYDEWSMERRGTSLSLNKELAEIIHACGVAGARNLMNKQYVRNYDINNFIGGGQRDMADAYFSSLIKLGALKQFHSNYQKSPGFIKVLKEYIRLPSSIDSYLNEERSEF